MLPQSIYQQRELEIQQKRYDKFPFLDFQKPQYNQSYYDFIINGNKVQEKVAVQVKKRVDKYVVCLYRSSNQKTMSDKRKYQPYMLGMNGFYWVNIPDTNTFYIFPEHILYLNGYIEGETKLNTTNPTFIIILNHDEGWYQKCKYDYENVDEIEFKNMFGLM
jgi:hypothetical protein